jgi:hypothetical protein
MENEESAQPCWLLELPDPCLQAVLQYCAADDLRSLISAAMSHSRLHQAAFTALPSITATIQQQHLGCVLRFLRKHSQDVRCISMRRARAGAGRINIALYQLPSNLQLSSLQLEGFALHPHGGLPGIPGSAALKQLRLRDCRLVHARQELLALSELPAGLEHLSISSSQCDTSYWLDRGWPGNATSAGLFDTVVLQQLPQLTYLELAGVLLNGSGDEAALQPLQAMTQLIDLRLGAYASVSASMLSGTCKLTRLEVSGGWFEPAALVAKPKLQHLCLQLCNRCPQHPGGAAAQPAQLLYHLGHLQQLTHLNVRESLKAVRDGTDLPAAAFLGLTASSMLQHLDVSRCTLPAGVWQYILPASRQLQSLNVSWATQPGIEGTEAAAPEGSRLAGSCPDLTSLDIRGLQCSAELLGPLRWLSKLHTLRLFDDQKCTAAAVMPTVCQMTGLRELGLACMSITEEGLILLQLTQLKQLTALEYTGPLDGAHTSIHLTKKVS